MAELFSIISYFIYNPKVHLHVQENFPMVHILSYTYPIHILKYYSQTIILIVFSHLHLVFPKCI